MLGPGIRENPAPEFPRPQPHEPPQLGSMLRNAPSLTARTLGAAAIALAGLTLGSCDDDDDSSAVTTVANSLQSAGLTTLASLLGQANLADTLDMGGPYTVFGPTDAAFAALPAGILSGLTDQELADLLSYHVVPGDLTAADLVAFDELTTLTGERVLVSQVGSTLYLNEVPVASADLPSTNGTIFAIDGVLSAPSQLLDTLTERGFTTLVTALEAAELDDDLSGPDLYTIVAPTDDAFAALPAGVLDDLLLPANQADLIALLEYHVLEGSTTLGQALELGDTKARDGSVIHFGLDATDVPRVNKKSISTLNVPTTNGVVHGVDSVLPLPRPVAESTQGSLLYLGLVVADLVETLDDTANDYTLFAPLDGPLAQTDPALIEYLIDPANFDELVDILLFHVSPGVLNSNEVLAEAALPTLLVGQDVEVSEDGGTPTVGGAPILNTDFVATNGLIHVMGGLLIPSTLVLPDEEPTLIVMEDGETSSEALYEAFRAAATGAIASESFQTKLAERLGGGRAAASHVPAGLAVGDLGRIALAQAGWSPLAAGAELARWEGLDAAPTFVTPLLAGASFGQVDAGELELLAPIAGRAAVLAVWGSDAVSLVGVDALVEGFAPHAEGVLSWFALAPMPIETLRLSGEGETWVTELTLP